MTTATITVNGQEIAYVTDAPIADAQQLSDYHDRAGRLIGKSGFHCGDYIIYASTRTIANMIYRKEYAN